MSRCHQQILELHCYADIKHSDWKLQVMWLVLTNHSALFHPCLAICLWHWVYSIKKFFVIYGHFAVNYGIFAIYEQFYVQNLGVTTNPVLTYL